MRKNNIAVQGFGFVGAANAVNIALSNIGLKKVICFEKKNERTKIIFSKAKKGIFPYSTNDIYLKNKFKKLVLNNKIKFTFDKADYRFTKTIIISINFDLKNYNESKKNFIQGFKDIINNIQDRTLIIIESTVPPGFCEKELKPLLIKIKKKKRFSKLFLSHSFERVMPGKDYLDSCRNNYRVYSGIDKKSSKACKEFLKKIVNINKFPLTHLENTTSSETCKIIENSYRALNIAFIDEWMKFCKNFNLNLFEIINAIKKRPTHSNIMYPGIGVGGYCLTKDPVFGNISNELYLKKNKNKFPLSSASIRINNQMINNSYDLILEKFGKKIQNKKILIIGISYKNDVGDLRDSPSISLAKKLKKQKCKISFFDPLVKNNIKNLIRLKSLNFNEKFDIILLCVKHENFNNLNFLKKRNCKRSYIFDLNNIIKDNLYKNIKKTNKIFKLSYPC